METWRELVARRPAGYRVPERFVAEPLESLTLTWGSVGSGPDGERAERFYELQSVDARGRVDRSCHLLRGGEEAPLLEWCRRRMWLAPAALPRVVVDEEGQLRSITF